MMAEKETQIEVEDKPAEAPKLDRDTITQTMDGDHGSCTETQTDLVQKIVITETATQPSKVNRAPSFVSPLKDLVVNEGERVVLECRYIFL